MNIFDWLPFVFSTAALAISALTYRDRRTSDRRDLFLKMHERLVDPDLQEGRRLLYERVGSKRDAAVLRADAKEDYQKINRALAMFDIFSMYVSRGYIDRKLALEEWGHSLGRAYAQAEPFIEERASVQSWTPWPHFRRFGPEAHDWHRKQSRRSPGGDG